MDNRFTLIACLSAFSLSLIVTRFMMWVNIADVPGKRSSHTRITPRAGGLGIFIAFYALWMAKGFSDLPQDDTFFYWTLSLLMSGVMGWMGLIDDIIGLRASLKLGIQLVIGLIYCSLGFKITAISLPLAGAIELGLWGGILTIFWIIVFTNALNFIDGLNGMASGGTLIACFFWYQITAQKGCEPLTYSALILMMSTLGFFIFNFPRGKIFMGDTGSLFIGSLFSIWAILGTMPYFGEISFYTIPLIFLIYLYDVIITRLRRLGRGHAFMKAHREHFFQLMNRIGWTHSQVSLFYMFFCILQGVAAVKMQSCPQDQHVWFFFPFLGVYSFLSWFIIRASRRKGIDV